MTVTNLRKVLSNYKLCTGVENEIFRNKPIVKDRRVQNK